MARLTNIGADLALINENLAKRSLADFKNADTFYQIMKLMKM